MTAAENPFYGFLYASGAVSFSATDAACQAEGTIVDVALQACWNWVTWHVMQDDTDTFSHVHLTAAERPEGVKLTLAGAI